MSVVPQSAMQMSPPPREVLAFVAIGGGAALSYVFVSAAAIALLPSMPDWIVSALCYAAYVIPVYVLHRRFTFRSDASHRQALPRYVTVQVIGVVAATVISWLTYDLLRLPPIVAAAIVIGLTSALNFVILRRWAFSVS